MNPISPAVLVIFAALMRLGSAQTTASVATTTTIVQGANVPIASLLQQSSISTTFYQYWAAANLYFDPTVQYTVFVPINSAWNNLSSTDQSALSACIPSGCSGSLATIMYYHMMLYTLQTSAFASNCLGQFGADTSTYKCRTLAVQSGNSQTHVAVTQVNNNWYVNGARIVLANQQAANFTVHFIDKWLYPIDTSTTASAYIATANNTAPAAGTLITTTCTMCSPVFNALYTKASQSLSSPLYNWFQNWPGSVTSSVTVFVPYSQAVASQYSINTLVSLISSLTASNNISFVASIAGAQIIQDKILYLAPWIASGASYTCGPTTPSLVTYGVSCSLTRVNPNTFAVEVGRTSANIIYADIPIENGVVHIVSNLLNYVYGNLWNVVQIHPSLTKFEQYLLQDSTGVALGMLQSSSSSYTVFACDDASWPTSINTSALGYNLQLGILQGSAIPYSSVFALLPTPTSVAMSASALVTGNRLRYSYSVSGTEVDGGPWNGFVTTYITQPDLGATNGILHVVTSNVYGMTQMTIAQFLLSRYDLTTSAANFGQMTQAWSLFSNNGGYYTVVVPNNAAWYTFNSNPQLAVISKTSILLQNMLLRHYTATNTQLYNSTQFASSGASLSVNTLNGVITYTAGNPMSGTTPPQYSVSYTSSAVANVVLSDILCTNGRVHIINTVLGVIADATNTQGLYSCQNPATCSSAALLVNFSVLVLGVLFGLFGRRV